MTTPQVCHAESGFRGGLTGLAGSTPGRTIADTRKSAGDLPDPRDHLVDRLFRRPLVHHHAVYRLRPDVLVVEHGEFPVLGELEGHGAGRELRVHDLAVRVL